MQAIATQNREDPRPGDEVLEENVSDKTQFATDAPAGAALIAQAMERREGAGRYKAMQSIMDWDRSRLAYRAVKRAFDIVFSGCVLAVITVPSLVLAAAIRLESEGNPFYSQIRVGQTRPDGSLSTFRMWKFRSMYKNADERLADLKEQNEIAGAMFKMREDPPCHQDRKIHPQALHRRVSAVRQRVSGSDERRWASSAAAERSRGVHRVRPTEASSEARYYGALAGDRAKLHRVRRHGPPGPRIHSQARSHHGLQDHPPNGSGGL